MSYPPDMKPAIGRMSISRIVSEDMSVSVQEMDAFQLEKITLLLTPLPTDPAGQYWFCGQRVRVLVSSEQ